MIISPLAQEFIDYWHCLPKHQSGMPTLSDLRLQRLPAVMPHVLMLELHSDDNKFYATINFAGSEKCNLFQGEMTGENLLFLFDKDIKAIIYNDLTQVAKFPAGMWIKSITPYKRGISTIDEVICLPVYDETKDKAIICMASIAEITHEYGPIDFENSKAIIQTPDHWLDIGYGIPEGKKMLKIIP